MMQENTKAELIIATVAGAFLLWLWNRNVQAGGGTGFSLPAFLMPERRVPGAAPMFDIPPPVSGDLFGYTGDAYANPANPAIGLTGAGDGGCNCQASANGNSTFGADTDLAAWLNNQPDLMAQAVSGIKGWY